VLREDVLGFSGLAEVVIAEVNATGVDRYAVRETLILEEVSMI
jgi:hypothetical protein